MKTTETRTTGMRERHPSAFNGDEDAPPSRAAIQCEDGLFPGPDAESVRFSSAGVIDFVERAVRSAVPGYKVRIEKVSVDPDYSIDDTELLSARGTIKFSLIKSSQQEEVGEEVDQ